MNFRPAQIISVIFHPLLVPTYALLVLTNLHSHFFLSMPPVYKYMVTAFVFLITFVMPALILLILRKFNVIKSLEMPERQERVMPLIMVAVFFYLAYYLLKQSEQNTIITLFMIGATMLVLFCLIINYFTKISIHATSWGGFLGALLGFSLRFQVDLVVWISVVLLVAGMVGTARLLLKVHTPAQVYNGFLLGILSQMLLFYFV